MDTFSILPSDPSPIISDILHFLNTLHAHPSLAPTNKSLNEGVEYIFKVFSKDNPHLYDQSFFEPIIDSGLNEKKCNARSEKARVIGNSLFHKEYLGEAHNFYTYSIAKAKTRSTQLALAYGNRSAVLFKMQLYKECIQDIARALENNYPEKLKTKLLERKLKATAKQRHQKVFRFHYDPPLLENPNKKLPATSQSIKVASNRQYGRHFVATKDIQLGESILIENPFAKVIMYEKCDRFFHCSECLEVCVSLIPCEKCSAAMYCGIECRRQAFVDYHRYECVILQHFGINIIDWTATRMTLKGLEEHHNPKSAYNKCGKLFFKQAEKISKEVISATAGVAKVFNCLKYQTELLSEFDFDNNESILKNLLFRDALICRFNRCNITKLSHLFNIKLYARGIYPTFSIFNHSCLENVICFYYGSTIVCKAMKSIKTGEQCFINYGAQLSDIFYASRKIDILSIHFDFVCDCDVCNNNTYMPEFFDKMHLMYRLRPIYEEIERLGKNGSRNKKTKLLKRALEVCQKEDSRLYNSNMMIDVYFALMSPGWNTDDFADNFEFID